MEKLKTIIIDALDNKEKTNALIGEDISTLYVYPWLRILLSLIGIPRVTYKVANLLSKHFSKQLLEEDDHTLIRIAYDQGLAIHLLNDGNSLVIRRHVRFGYFMHFLDYLKMASILKSPAWKLVNRLVKDGRVYLLKKDIARMIEEAIKEKISAIAKTSMNKDVKIDLMDDLLIKSFIDDINKIIESRMTRSDIDFGNVPVTESAFPPCLKAILDKNGQGINLTHSERLFLSYFLLNIGYDVEQVLDIFKSQPDYNEKIARYQVEYAAGLHGKRTVYKPHNCNTLESLNICKKHDEKYTHPFCSHPKYPLRNPLTFYRRVINMKNKDEDKSKQHAGSENKGVNKK
ncbi:MAG: hypothetical protein ACTSWN_00290 [Promethearchaeota archaeon]